ncbi:adenylyl-sulfate kinase [Candidatus Peregrinibacteria bacterium]|nr:adenylyl-sulfate kinase [Candidatus Peregrinibacteria bacterium]
MTSTMKTGVFIGRFQPFHDGHKQCIEKILLENNRCLILLRDNEQSEKNPFELAKRKAMIRAAFPDEKRVEISVVFDPGADLTVYIGRDVGYNLIQLDSQTEAISDTDIRKKLYEGRGQEWPLSGSKNNISLTRQPFLAAVRFPIFWLTGNTGSGKTTLAKTIETYFNNEKSASDHPATRRVIVLDGDEMRQTISTQETLTPKDRRNHNLRVARLAKLFQAKGFLVVVSVIAPFENVRAEIDGVCSPLWIYLKRSGLEKADRPYEFPTHPALVLDQDVLSMKEGSDRLLRYILGTLAKDTAIRRSRMSVKVA